MVSISAVNVLELRRAPHLTVGGVDAVQLDVVLGVEQDEPFECLGAAHMGEVSTKHGAADASHGR